MYEKEPDTRNIFFGHVDDEPLEEDSSPSIPDPPEEELLETSAVVWTRGSNGKLIRT